MSGVEASQMSMSDKKVSDEKLIDLHNDPKAAGSLGVVCFDVIG